MSYFWVPVIGTGASAKDAQRASVPSGIAFQYALPIQINATTGKTTVSTVPISVAARVTVSTAVAAPPIADATVYSAALAKLVSIGAMAQAQAATLAAALGLTLS